ncbi:MAG: hypothetical protein NC827_08740, partial [Candidatus Omnitrophica bacterium]|nr:hypothetical protein [Candidatus Omnitrophota bacterium]
MKKLIKKPVFKEQVINFSEQLIRSSDNSLFIRFPFRYFFKVIIFKFWTMFSYTFSHNKGYSS